MKFIKIRAMLVTAAITVMCGVSAFAANMVNLKLVYDGATHKYSAEEIKINVKGTVLTEYNIPPVILNDRTLVPLRAVTESLGAEIVWNEELKEVYITQGNDVVVMKINSTTAIKNGSEFNMEIPPKIINNSTMIPVRYLAEALNCVVEWDGKTRVVYVKDKPVEEPPKEDENTGNSGNNTGNNGNTGNSGSNTEKPEDVTTPTYNNINITNVKVHDIINSTQSFTIEATGQIGKYKKLAVGNDRIAIDIYGATMNMSNSSIDADGPVVSSVRIGQNQVEPEKITRIVFDLNKSSDCTIGLDNGNKNLIVSFREGSGNSNNNDETVIVPPSNVVPPTTPTTPEPPVVAVNPFTNLEYDSKTRVVTLKKEKGILANSIKHSDNYINNLYSMELPGDYSDIYGSGSYNVNDNYLNSITLKNSGGVTSIIFSQKSVYAYTVTEDNSNIYIKVQNPKEVYSKVVVIDAGHGKKDQGTSGNGLLEKDINLKILLKLYNKLEANTDIKVYATRLGDTYPENAGRIAMANSIGDLFVSIHQNSASPNPVPNGIETLYTPNTGEKSGKLTSKIAADIMQEHLITLLGVTDRGVKNRPDLIVLNQSKVPAILIEDGFLSNTEEAAKLATDSYQEQVADAIYIGIVDILYRNSIR